MTPLLTSKGISDTQSNCKPLTTSYIADFSTKLTAIQKPPTNEEKWFSPQWPVKRWRTGRLYSFFPEFVSLSKG